jgi:signal transduction histidine kinase
MEEAHRLFPDLVVILMTGFGTIETAVKALKGGAYDYILKPFKLDEILHSVGRALEHQRLQAENIQLQEMNRRLAEIDQIKMNLLRAISHEFRTPLTVICGWVDLIFGELSSSESSLLTEGLNAIRDSSLRLNRMIFNLLEFVAISRDQVRIKSDDVELLPLVEGAWKQLEEEAKEEGVSLVKVFPPDLPRLRADSEKMKVVILNLLENAIKFNESGGSVLVEGAAEKDRNEVLLRIHNTQGEIPPDRLSELLKPFAQADMSITRSGSGLGLGLTVAKGIVEAHQGKLLIWSEPGKGTTVEVHLPLPEKQ